MLTATVQMPNIRYKNPITKPPYQVIELIYQCNYIIQYSCTIVNRKTQNFCLISNVFITKIVLNRPNNILVVKFAYIMYNNKSNDTEKVIAVTIEKIKRIYASTAIYKFSQGLKNAETDDFDSAFDNVLDFFGNKIEEDALKIECSGDEVNMMFLDFVRMLSSTRHLAMCVFVNGNADVDTVKRLERFSGWSECFKVVRDMNKHDDKICIYIGFINWFDGEIYDVDYTVNVIM